MTTRAIQQHLEEIYGTGVSVALSSAVTDGVPHEVKDGQSRPLDAPCPVIHLDAIYTSRDISINY